jgi:hypothetical protein
VPIHPLVRLARQSLATSSIRGSPSRLLSSSSRHYYAKPSSRNAARDNQSNDRKNSAPQASLSPSSASSSSSRQIKDDGVTPSISLDSIAHHSYAASTSGKPASPPPAASVKLTDNRSQKAQKDAKREQEEMSKAREDAKMSSKDHSAKDSGGDQKGDEAKVSKGASLHPRAVENDRRATSSKATAQQEKSRSSTTTNIIDGSTGASASSSTDGASTGKVTEGILIPHNGIVGSFGPPSSSTNSEAASTEASSSTPLTGISSENKESSGSFIPPRSETTRSQTGEEESGPPAMTQISELGQIRPANPLHPFDTHAFIKRLEDAGFTMKPLVEETEGAKSAKTTETSLSTVKRHDPAEAIMEALRHLLISRGERVLDQHISKTEVDNQGYLFTAALSELRTELQVRARNDAAALRSMVTLLQREVDGLSQKMREDTGAMKHDIQVDMNKRKSEAKEEQNTLEQEIQDLNNRFTISISDLK